MRWRVAGALLLLIFCAAAPAQEKKAKEDEKDKIPPPQDLTLTTADGVQLFVTYYPSRRGKESVPVVLLHMWKGSRKDYRELAVHLQSLDHAVLVPDLRGHGESTTRRYGTRSETLNASHLASQEFKNMAKLDMVMVRELLWEKNNAGELNLNKLCVVGAEMGASVAMDFALYDALGYFEGNPPGNPMYGPLQVGCFVKAMVLISPEWSFKGLVMKAPLENAYVRQRIAMLIMVGSETAAADRDAGKIHGILGRYHEEPTGEKKVEKKTLFLGRMETGLQGTKMLSDKKLNLENHIAKFVYLRLINSEEAKTIVWKELKKPHRG